MLLALHRDFRQVDRHSVVHFVMVQIVLDQKSHELSLRIFVNLTSNWVLPLKASSLLGVLISVVLNCFEHLSPQLSSQRRKSSFLLQVLDYNVLQIVHTNLN